MFKIRYSPSYLINLATTFLSQACSAALVILLLPVLQKNFSIEEFANYGVLLSIISFATVFDFGLNIGLLRRLIHEREKASSLISSAFFFYCLFLVIAVPLFFILYYTHVLGIGDNFLSYAFLTSILIVQIIVAMLFDIIIQTTNRIFVGKLVRIGKTIIEFIVLFYCSRKGSGELLLLASSIINFFFIVVLFWFSKKELQYKISFANFSWSVLTGHIRYSFWYFLNAVGVAIVFSSQVVLLNEVVSKEDVAKYFLVSRFLDIVRMGATNFTTILFPSIASIEAQGEWNDLRKMYFNVLKRIIALSVVCLLFLLTAGKWIFDYWSGQQGPEINELYTIFSIFTALIVIDNVSSVFLHALRLNRMQTLISIGQGVLALVVGYFLLKKMGLAGMAIGSLIALVATNFIYNPAYLISQIRKKTA